MGKEFHGRIQLASKGIFYGDELPEGYVHADPWGSEEEAILLSPTLDFEEILDTLFQKLTDLPFHPENLTLPDRLHLFFYMRCLSYGGDYEFRFRCEDCSQPSKTPFDLEQELNTIYVDDTRVLENMGVSDVSELTEPFHFMLPLTGSDIGWRQLVGKDIKSIRKYKVRTQKRNAVLARRKRVEHNYRRALRIAEIDGTKVNLGEALAFVETLKGKDTLALTQEVDALDYGVETEIDVKCSECGYPNELELPMDKSFFRPPRRVAKAS